jgi:hypothetical protein
MAEEHEDRLRQHAEMIQGLARLWSAQHDLNQRLTLAIERIDQTLAQHTEFHGDVRTTLARIETLLARMLPTGENGREA